MIETLSTLSTLNITKQYREEVLFLPSLNKTLMYPMYLMSAYIWTLSTLDTLNITTAHKEIKVKNNYSVDLNTKYRPQNWQSFKGQSKIVHMLKKQAITKKHLFKSYIFHGPSGVGKTTLARLFFRALNCSNLSEEGDPCLTCEMCKQANFNLEEENAANNRGVENMRRLIDLTYGLLVCGYRVIIVDECHNLLDLSWDSLLKAIEEGPKNAIWIFVTTKFKKIIPTILTRCQILKFNPIYVTDIYKRLKEIAKCENSQITDEELMEIARNSESNLRQAIKLLQENL